VRYANYGYGKQVLADICRTEKKTPAEVLEILHSRGLAKKFKEEDITTVSYVKFSPELRAQVISDKAEGLTNAEIADKNGITVNQVNSIIAAHNAQMRRQLKSEKIELTAEVAESFIDAVERSAAPTGEINMFAALLALQEFAKNELARGDDFNYVETGMFADKYAMVHFSSGGYEYTLNLGRVLVKHDEQQ